MLLLFMFYADYLKFKHSLTHLIKKKVFTSLTGDGFQVNRQMGSYY